MNAFPLKPDQCRLLQPQPDDALSEVLRSLRLRGSISVAWELAAPWGFLLQPACSSPFHLVQSGRCLLVTDDGRRVELSAGDIVVLFDGAGHRICDSDTSPIEPIDGILAGGPEHAAVRRDGGGGARTRMISGRFAVDDRESASATLQHLPRLVHIPRARSARVKPFAAALDLLVAETRRRETGSECVASLLTEVLLIHVIRAVLDDAHGPPLRGLLEGLRDPQLSAALAAIHGRPEQPWSVDLLAANVGMSRSAFAARFGERLGQPPMAYLAQWRAQLAARLLRDTSLAVSEIHQRVGYASAPAFNRAFKQFHRASPTAYRKHFAPRSSLGKR